ncbi:MAG: AraC family transcriptional regulator [Azospirillaceae bacterium]
MLPTRVAPILHAETLRCALHDRVFSLSQLAGERAWLGILMTSGSGAILSGDDALPLAAPCLAWAPWRDDRRLMVHAGGVGQQVAVDGQVLANAIGHGADSADLRLNAERTVVVGLEARAAALGEARHAFAVMLREAAEPCQGSGSMIEAQMRAILVLIWRHSAFAEAPPLQARSARLLQHFRQLLEVHFRDRWTIARYADALGIAPDHLHDICRRELGKPPRLLVQERLIHEARLMLETSTLTVDQIAAAVGFRDTGHFSRFFKAKSALAPGAYRKAVTSSAGESTGLATSSYADWP